MQNDDKEVLQQRKGLTSLKVKGFFNWSSD